MNYERRAMTEAEGKYTFSQSSQISSQTGLIGNLIADMGTERGCYYRAWESWRKDLQNADFNEEFNEIINSLQEEGDILHSRKNLMNYCYSNPQSKMGTDRDEYGVRIDTDEYTYLLRLTPNKGEYNLYCYCYVKKWLDSHLKKAAQGIRFIDSSYNELFRIPDGGKIKIRYVDGDEKVRTCRFIDEYHTEIDCDIYHICQYAEMMERNGHTYEPYEEGSNR